jgi:hypothetical protein
VAALLVAVFVAYQKHSLQISALDPSLRQQSAAHDIQVAGLQCPKDDRQLFEALVRYLTKEHGALLSNVELDYWNGVRGLKVKMGTFLEVHEPAS